MLKLIETKKYKKHLKKYRSNAKILDELEKIIILLRNQKLIPEKYCDHQLKGKMGYIRELHLKPDNLLLYYIITKDNLLTLVDIGSHSDIFG